uniref:Uncharacterized protein n=1 Tax=Tetradesmus obliquus TaxID=3088 RepID=A0A383VJJ2_TETOB|eukprot:jgi/Sobl393_1/4257/SZX65698.1
MAQQQHGTRSTFGPQAVSNRASSPTTKFGSGGRTTKTWDKAWESTLLGRTSPWATTMVKSSIGSQAESRCKSAPAHKIPTAALHDKPRSPNIGPGAYNTPTDTLGLQCVESQRPRSAAYKLGTSPRWCEFKGALTGGPAQPVLVNSRLPVGYLGDAPAWSFHGPQQRRPLTAAGSSSGSSSLCCPLAPTSASSPGPGAYAAACSAFGRQVPSSALSSPAASVPQAQRDKLMRQALPRGQQQALMGHASPGPCYPQASRARSSTGMKFGSSDRFSDTKPAAALKKSPSSNSSRSNGGGSSSGGNTARSASGAGQAAGSAGRDSAAAAWPFSSPGPGAYIV